MRRRDNTRKALGALAIVAIIAGIVATIGYSSSRTAAVPRLPAVSNAGTLVSAMTDEQRLALARANVDGQVYKLGKRAGVSFYTATQNGRPCFIVGADEAVAEKFGLIACLGADSAAELSDQQPVVDVSTFLRRAADSSARVQLLAGYAADGVASVGVLTTDGTIASTPVRNNIYAARNLTASGVTAVVALDAGGNIVYRSNLGRG